MNSLQKQLDSIFKLVSSIPVSGGYVDVMAAAMAGLRRAYQAAADPEPKEADADGR